MRVNIGVGGIRKALSGYTEPGIKRFQLMSMFEQ